MKICCVNCDYFEKASALQGGRGGVCRKNPAIGVFVADPRTGNGMSFAYWPPVAVQSENDWCAEGAPRTGDAPRPLKQAAIVNS